MNTTMESSSRTSGNPNEADCSTEGSRNLSPEELRERGAKEMTSWVLPEGAKKPTKNKVRVDRWKEKAAAQGLANVTVTAPKLHHAFVKEMAREMKSGAAPVTAALVAAARGEEEARGIAGTPPSLWARLRRFVGAVLLAARALYNIHLSPMRAEDLNASGTKIP